MIFDDTRCALGEGPLWHPVRESLFWFDIINARMFERNREDTSARIWQFDEMVSAAGWIDEDTLLIASETALFRYGLSSGVREDLVPLEQDTLQTRSNDGRADAWGGFWIGTMGKKAETAAGAIYRFYDGELVRLFDNITISNSICFSPSGRTAYFTDTKKRKIMQVELDGQGWPVGEPMIFVDVDPFNPDGSVVDSKGNLWNAQWGGSRVAGYDPLGKLVGTHHFDSPQISCPAIGGENLDILFVTSAAIGLVGDDLDDAGKTFISAGTVQGQSEHQVKLGRR